MADGRFRRVGHKGADLIAPGNTSRSFDAALTAGVDMIEFDVLPEPPADWRTVSVVAAERRKYPGQRLLLAHDWADACSRQALVLEEGLDHLASAPFSDVELNLDLKLPGYELRVVEALRERGLLERTLVSSHYRRSLQLIRRRQPDLRLGWSVPRLRRDPFRYRAMVPAVLILAQLWRAVIPARAAAAIRSGACDAIMAHWRLVTPRLVRAVAGAGGELYVWTVDELPLMRRLQDLGVTGVISNDPRLFSGLSVPAG
ncbi:MAG TPA: glycerophosphodiester phosphodiesterase [Solirubrobacteraceae bacterium]|jgi:glycerophosphoryl diester phosphodiesterase|nr:glycerophosphodiester phosphodiesterase [Solirubrobacteraceae bacterium]